MVCITALFMNCFYRHYVVLNCIKGFHISPHTSCNCFQIFYFKALILSYLGIECLPLVILEVGQQQAAMFFRSEPNWELAEPLRDLGMLDFWWSIVLWRHNCDLIHHLTVDFEPFLLEICPYHNYILLLQHNSLYCASVKHLSTMHGNINPMECSQENGLFTMWGEKSWWFRMQENWC